MQGEPLVINGINIKELEEGESYRYLGVDENIEYNCIINKERILKEYYRRVKVILSSELICGSHPSTNYWNFRVEHQGAGRYRQTGT